ncbi:4-(cytidine 5'-diphospho)-2-C-methyl-D-erythritol kinase [bacterium]|nr:MAG: 4-(cytidine 5'-diphospho)-2-C-methyl-D-erythritol kinase [bacterium]
MPIFKSPAKINLFLRVLRKRQDNYHDIFSLMQPVSLYDEVAVEISKGDLITVACSRPDLPTDSSNIAFRAAELFLKRTGLKRRVDIRINKNIPVGAGLGGGSSNAATVLKACDSLLKTNINEKELMNIAAELGSDVPFFILDVPALAHGRGEVLKKVIIAPYAYVLVNPGFMVSTAWVYGNLDLTNISEDNILSYSDEVYADIDSLVKLFVNDLEAVTLRKHPELLGVKSALIESGAVQALMSGSGPTVFGIFRSKALADIAARGLTERFIGKGYSVFSVEGVV